MSIANEPQYDPNYSPNPNMQQPASSKKWWLFGGCGCLVVLVLCCGGVGYFGFLVYKPAQEFIQETKVLAETSEVIQEKLGNNVKLNEQPVETSNSTRDGGAELNFVFELKGDDKSGRLHVKAFMKSLSVWERESMQLEVDGEMIDIDPESEMILDIDEGGGE